MDHLSAKGYKRAIDKIWGPVAKKRIFGPKKSVHFLILTMF